VGIDNNPAMLSVARANLAAANIANAQVRLGDVYHLEIPENRFDSVIIHQVLHYLDEPLKAISQAAKTLKPQGLMLIVDFAPHEQEFLREEQAHRRLGFSDETIQNWLSEVNLQMIAQKNLKPIKSSDLTVCLWLARDNRINGEA
jgi:ubiquinone/menaquinone biosynthesis C-methylase UbiE